MNQPRPNLFYFCPDLKIRSAGIRILYRHVEILQRHGFPAAILHQHVGFQLPDVPAVPVHYLAAQNTLAPGDVVVMPEAVPAIMNLVKDAPLRRLCIALNWRYPYMTLPDQVDWRAFGIERILTHSPFIGDFLTWAMGLPSHVFIWGVKPDLYYFERAEKRLLVTYIKRKQAEMPELMRVLHSRNPAFVKRIEWQALDNLSEAEYAARVRASSLFLNMSTAEGLPCSLLEAMRSGTLVAGYNSVGGQRELISAGPRQNCILAENLDYVALAQQLEPVLSDLVTVGSLDRFEQIRTNGLATASEYTLEAEEASVVGLWNELLQS